MNFAGLLGDDIADATDGFCVSLWFAGCDIQCSGCHNKMYWEVESGEVVDNVIVTKEVFRLLTKNGIDRSFSVLGGEPLMLQNRADCADIIRSVRKKYPKKTIRLWTGRDFDKVIEESKTDSSIKMILEDIDYLITGPYIDSRRTTDKPLIGSDNQEIYKKGADGKFTKD